MRQTNYLAQSFADGRGGLKADPAIRCKSEEGAPHRRASRETKAGAVAFSSTGDAELGDFDDEVVILSVVGRIPENFKH